LILIHGLTAVSAAAMLIRAILVHVPPEQPRAQTQPPTSTAPAAVASAPRSAEPSLEGAAAPRAGAASASPSGSAPAAQTPSDAFVVDESVKSVLERPINFETNSSEVSQDSESALAEIASALKAHPEIGLIEVQGHADERGGDGKNIALTRARAAAVVSALVDKGVGRERLHSAGYGARCPDDPACRASDAPASCHDASNWQRDRRVVFLVLQVNKAAYRGEVACARGAELIPPADKRFHKRD
jgi:outer membrane protein OmpA-like peptidoglycan-associated protein